MSIAEFGVLVLFTLLVLAIIFLSWREEIPRKMPDNWRVGDFVEVLGEYGPSGIITHISPDRRRFLINDSVIKYSTKWYNSTAERRKREYIKDEFIKESEDYTQALQELYKKYDL